MSVYLDVLELAEQVGCPRVTTRVPDGDRGPQRINDRRSAPRHFVHRRAAHPAPVRSGHRATPAHDQASTTATLETRLFPGLRLTDREREVAELAVVGLSYAQIARDLFVSQSTVSYHLSNIYQKSGVRTRHELTELARSATPTPAAW